MANTFYFDACSVDARFSPYSGEYVQKTIGGNNSKLQFMEPKGKPILGPHSIMNEHVAVNYRTIYNFYALPGNATQFTDYNDYLRCKNRSTTMNEFLQAKQNPTYQNILKYYSDPTFDKYGLAKYRMQDFIYLKYYNQIPNNYMVTLRRYTRPCEDHMFGIDAPAALTNAMNGFPDTFVNIATAVTYMGEQTGNKLSEILKFDYGANWEDKQAKVESLQNPDGGLAAQMRDRAGVDDSFMSGEANLFQMGAKNSVLNALKFAGMSLGSGVSVGDALASQHKPEGDIFAQRYGEEFYGDMNVIQNVKLRSRGLTFTNSFSLTFEYSLKSLKCVNPRVAMMDILTNFLVLTGNYGSFWGGATIFYGQHNIAPQFGDPRLLREGKYGEYMESLWDSVKSGFSQLAASGGAAEGDNILEKIVGTGKALLSGGFQALLGNLLGGNIGVAGQSQVTQALLSGAPSGYWHVTIGNPLDPIAMMGNMAVTKTTVEFSDVLGYDDFPTEVKFIVDLEHARPRDNAAIENMFNGAKGRFYTFTDAGIENAYHNVDILNNFQGDHNMKHQEVNVHFNGNGLPTNNEMIKIAGGFLNQ